MHAASLPLVPSPSAAAGGLPQARRALQRGFGLLRRNAAAASPAGSRQLCRAATLPPIDELHEACAPEGAIYVDGVLFGAGSAD